MPFLFSFRSDIFRSSSWRWSSTFQMLHLFLPRWCPFAIAPSWAYKETHTCSIAEKNGSTTTTTPATTEIDEQTENDFAQHSNSKCVQCKMQKVFSCGSKRERFGLSLRNDLTRGTNRNAEKMNFFSWFGNAAASISVNQKHHRICT